jgi:hypothetical protein
MQRRDLIALTGVLFVALLVAGFIVGGDTPDGDSAGAKVVAHYKDNEAKNVIAIILIALSTVPMLFFASTFRERARAALPGRSVIPNVILLAGGLTAAGLLGAGVIHLALTDLGDEISAPAAQALNALDNDSWIAFAPPVAMLMLGGSLAAIRGALLPTWLGWVGVVLFVLQFTPAGFFAAMLALVWIIIVSVLLYLRGETSGLAPDERAAPVPTA